jgi:AraC family transcriptional regulator, regulatory protein of adaptative response / methylated-DNA-[protein]-cysteine methyltransferase
MTIHQRYYQALLEKNSEYEGLFYVGVRTTGVFCRPTCPAPKPKFDNCEFFESPDQALLAGFRPCKRCRPLSSPNQVPEFMQDLIQAVEADPDRKWGSDDVREFHVDPSTARRGFKKHFGMTFVEYARARRLGVAMKKIREGLPVIEAQVTAGYESGSGFRDAFSRIMGDAPSLAGRSRVLEAAWIDTQLGPMVAVADESSLYLLEYVDRRGLEGEIEYLRKKLRAAIIPGRTEPIDQIEQEIGGYFAGDTRAFVTPVARIGTPFQRLVWDALSKIPFGETRSYSQLADTIGRPSAVRAVAQANGANRLAIVIPCHRVINSNGGLGGYGGGLSRKTWLIQHEKSACDLAASVSVRSIACIV